MSRRRSAAADANVQEDVPNKIWRANPPGPEQKELNRMFQKGIIGSADTPGKVRLRNQMFMAFPPKTFALHFRTTKAKYGLNAVAAATGIPELDGTEEEPSQGRESSSKSPVIFAETLIEAINFPYIAWTYNDHYEQKEIVCVAVPTITGCRDIKFVVADDGMRLFVEYVWPFPLLNAAELFHDVDDDDGGAIAMSHPMVYSFRNRLDELDLSDKSKPNGSLVIHLPTRIQRELGTYKKQGLTCGETKIVLLQFTGYQKKRVINEADNSIKF